MTISRLLPLRSSPPPPFSQQKIGRRKKSARGVVFFFGEKGPRFFAKNTWAKMGLSFGSWCPGARFLWFVRGDQKAAEAKGGRSDGPTKERTHPNPGAKFDRAEGFSADMSPEIGRLPGSKAGGPTLSKNWTPKENAAVPRPTEIQASLAFFLLAFFSRLRKRRGDVQPKSIPFLCGAKANKPRGWPKAKKRRKKKRS